MKTVKKIHKRRLLLEVTKTHNKGNEHLIK
jgi:hypothetical protein